MAHGFELPANGAGHHCITDSRKPFPMVGIQEGYARAIAQVGPTRTTRGVSFASSMRAPGTSIRVGALHGWPELPITARDVEVLAVVHGASFRRLAVLPPACAFITHDEIRLLSLCFAAQAGCSASALRQADALVGPERSRLLFDSIEQLVGILSRWSIRLSPSTSALLRAYH